MLPDKNSAYVPQGIDRIIGQYRGQPNVTAWITSFLEQCQEIEDVLWDILASQLLTRVVPAGPPDQALLQLADLVGCPIGTYDGPQLAFLIQVWIQARRSKGRSEDLIGILAKVFPGGFDYEEYFPAAYEAWITNIVDLSYVSPLVQALRIARPPGVHGVVAYGAWPAATFFLGDPYGAAPGSGFKDPYGPSNAMGLLAAAEV